MATSKREQFANNAVDALDGDIDETVTTLDVTDASAFPTDGNFRILIDSEIMLVTAVSTNTFTVVRGQEGTTAASHIDGATVTHLLTKGAFERTLYDNVQRAYSGVVPYGIFDATGQRITSSDFTWLNQNSATVDDYDNYISLNDVSAAADSAHYIRGLYMNCPSTPWSVVACVEGWAKGASNGDIKWGIFLRESSTGKLITYEFTTHTSLRREYWNSATAPVQATNRGGRFYTCRWLKITDDGTNLKFYVGVNGMHWAETVASVSRTAHLAGGPDEVGFHINRFNNVSYQVGMDLLHWSFQ